MLRILYRCHTHACLQIVIFIGMVLAIDYTVVLVSLPNYWTNVAPSKSNLLGLVVGMYDLSQFMFAPIFGMLSDSYGIKKCFIFALIINIFGNVLYSLGIVVGGYEGIDSGKQPIWGTYWLLILGRFVAGIGSAALGLSAVYFTRTTSVADRQLAMAAQQGKTRICFLTTIFTLLLWCCQRLWCLPAPSARASAPSWSCSCHRISSKTPSRNRSSIS